MAWTYKNYTDNEATLKAQAERDKLLTEKPSDFTYNDYVESDSVTAAKNALNQQLANKPGAYQSQWQQSLDDTINKILNREKFSYDLNGDMLYQQYKDQYMNQGKMAMMDTIGQASAMTGGYGNSYAQSVGQQTYQGYLQQLNDKVPELYQLALDQYNREGDELYNQYGLFADRENTDYGRYRDTVSDFNTERDYLTNMYYNESDRDYNRYTDNRNFDYGVHRDTVADWQNALNRADNIYFNERDFGYGQYSDDKNLSYTDYRNAIADDQWAKDFAEAQRQFNEQMAETQRANRASEAAAWARANAQNNKDDEDEGESESDYSDWNAGDWESYFAQIRQAEGVEAAQAELAEFNKNGYIPQNMVVYASSGARGGKMGH